MRSFFAPGGGTSGGPSSDRIYIEVLAPPKATVGTWTVYANANYIHGGFRYNTSNALNDSIAWEVNLAAGTWELWTLHVVDGARGIVTWELDDGAGNYTSLGVVDGYSASELTVENTISGIVVASTVPARTLRARVSGQNVLATGRLFSPIVVHLRRTA